MDVGNDGPWTGGGLDFWLSVLRSGRWFVMVDEMRYDTLVLCFSIATVIMQVLDELTSSLSILCSVLCRNYGDEHIPMIAI